MRVSEYLDLEDGGELLGRARESWGDWSEREPRLAVVGFDELREWLAEVHPGEADEVLHALATLAASDGGDEVAAASVLAWVLLPGACSLVRKLRGVSGDASVMVAAQLWIEVRSFPWRRLRKVAANVLLNTRAACLREGGTSSQMRRSDRTWSATDVIDPASFFWVHIAAGDRPGLRVQAAFPEGRRRSESDEVAMARATKLARIPLVCEPAREVAELLDWACENDVISLKDRDLLLCLVDEADRVDVRRVSRSNFGLTATAISVRVAPRCGLAQATVRRRATHSIQALAEAVDRYVA